MITAPREIVFIKMFTILYSWHFVVRKISHVIGFSDLEDQAENISVENLAIIFYGSEIWTVTKSRAQPSAVFPEH